MKRSPAPELESHPRVWRQFVQAALTATLPRRWLLARGPHRSGSVCLTFDDGPDPQHTPGLLDALKDHGVVATFFVVGRRVEEHPELVLRMVAEGHVVGGHSFSHSKPGQTSARQLLDEVRRTRDLLAPLIGGDTNLFRPPHGKLTAAKLLGLLSHGQTIVLWNADPKDFARRSTDELVAWFRARPPRAGDIILMHDNHQHAAGALPELAASARERGLTFSTIPQWLR
jgi:peptidoglycan/xylan/chitin deacetylase (PgdA/CDA1 family)